MANLTSMLTIRRNLNKVRRSQRIISVFVKFGLDYLFDRSKINLLARFHRKTKKLRQLSAPERLRRAFEELGPTFIKFGQVLSTRPDFLPSEFIRELEKLQDEVPPFDSQEAKKILEIELKAPLDNLFKEFNQDPVASASLSQVHRAVLKGGEVVAVKIQRPGIKEIIELDLEILEDLAGIVENHLSSGWVYQPKLIVEEFKKAIRKELDFIEEAYNFEKFRLNFRNIAYLKVPKIYWELTTNKVLTMEFIEGVKINEITQEKYRQVFEAKKVAQEGAEAVLKQILEDGFFQADPHPANLFVQPPATIVMLDVGMTGYLEEKSIISILRVLRAVADIDLDEIITGMEDLGIIMEAVDRNRLRQDLVELIERYSGRPLKTIKVSNLSQDIFELMVRHSLVVPSNLVLMIRALSIVESIGWDLDPDFDLLSTFKPFVKQLLWKRYSPATWLKKGQSFLDQSLELFGHLPRDLADLFRKVKEGQLKISFEHRGLENLTREIDRASNRISFSLIIAALIIGSSLLLQQKIGPTIFGVSAVGILGYLLASLLGVGLIVSILRSGKWK
ncbi:MAG: ABC1 kinase family protein [Candidatus Saccharicenans sp.]|nr:MAG: hypothetical protein C0168_03160 [Candidatus Aminicenantes bacterium]HEK86001.1 AarF/ABC1/UbiB kinase family protein [Candidatus Aminicenantes bacterium]